MTRRSSDRQSQQNREKTLQKKRPAASVGAESAALAPLPYFAAILFLLLACVMSAMLVLEHLWGISLPGCGPGSECAKAAASIWGKVPYINWPVSFLGFAYFLGALVAWLSSRAGVATAFRWLARLGALASLGFLMVIIFGGYHCKYCLAAHAGNFGFWACMEFSRKASVASLRPVVTTVAVFLVASLLLGIINLREKRIAGQKQETLLADSTSQIIHAQPSTAQSPATVAVPGAATQSEKDPFPNGFTGRYRLGPEQAPVRLVMLTDYQCTDCNRVEKDVRKMLSERTDVSLSIKHFPMCADCNEKFKQQNMHPNACWAARAAEAAGILRGNDGFWQMHYWLFDQKGSFTDPEFKRGLTELGYDPQEFTKVMMSPETLKRVQADIAEGVLLGLHFTPMVFINGVELKGVFADQAIPRAVAAVAAKNPPPMTSANDHPSLAVDKYVSDWREGGVQPMPPDSHPWPKGPDNARIRIVMWSDYQEPETPKADGIIRKWMSGRTDVQYVFRLFPFNQECNSIVSRSPHPMACKASRAAKAAGMLGGIDGYWKMHDWLMTHQAEVNDDTLRRAATEMGLDAKTFVEAMNGPEVKAAIDEDVKVGKQMLFRGGIPTIYVNGKIIPRWRLEDKPVLELILNEAALPASKP
jgi:protein-disulfide isomerase